MKHEAIVLTEQLLRGAFDEHPYKDDIEVVLRDYELLCGVFAAADTVLEQVDQGGTVIVAPSIDAVQQLDRAISARNRG